MTVSAETWLPLGPLEDMEEGERREVALPTGKIILLIRAEEKIHAVCADCISGSGISERAKRLASRSFRWKFSSCAMKTANGSFAHKSCRSPSKELGNREGRGAWTGWPYQGRYWLSPSHPSCAD